MSKANPKTIIVTGASQGIGASLATAFVERGYNVVANAFNFTGSAITSNGKLVVVEGNIGKASTAGEVAEAAIQRFGSIDGVVNNAGIFFTKRFTDYTSEDFERLAETNLGHCRCSGLSHRSAPRNCGGAACGRRRA